MKALKSLTLTALTALSAFQVGCTDREVASGIGGFALGAIIVDAARSSPPPRRTRTCEIYREKKTVGYRDYNGNWVETTAYRNESTCPPGYRKMELGTEQTGTPVDAVAVAETYKMSPEAAQTLVQALTQAQTATDDASAAAALASIGIERADAEKLAQFQSPDDVGVDRIARALNQSPESTKMMLTSIMAEAAAQKAARDSEKL